MSWTKRQRIEAVFNGEQPDRVPIYDLLVNDEAVEFYAGRRLEAVGGYETVCKAIGNCLDMTRDIYAPFEPGTKTDSRGFVRRYERWMNWIVGYPFKGQEGMIRFIQDDIDRLEAFDLSQTDIETFHAECDRTQRLIGDTVDIFVCPNAAVNYAFGEIGMEPLCYLIHDEPELSTRWFKAAAQADLRRVDRLADPARSPVSLIYADVAQKGGLIFPLDFLQANLLPQVRETCDLLHARGMKVVFHSDGDITPLLPDLVNAGVDGLNPIEIAAGMDVQAIKERFGRKLVLCGGMDVTHLMPNGTRDQVVQATKDLIRKAGGDFGLCLGSTTELGWDIPLENIRAMVETVWEHGRYPLA